MTSSLFKSFSLDFLGRIGQQIAGFGLGIILARLLSPEEFGLIGMSMVFISFTSFFVSTGLFSAIIQRKELTEDHLSSTFFFNIFSSFVLITIMMFLAPFVSDFYEMEELTLIVKVLSFTMLIGALRIVQEALLRRAMRFDIIAKASIYSTLISGGVGVVLAWQGFGVWSLVTQTLLIYIIQTVFYWYASDWQPKVIFKIKAIKQLWSFGFNMFLSGLVNTGVSQLDALVIGKLFSSHDLGLYNRAKTLNGFVVRYSSESISAVTFPAMSALQEQKEKLIQLGLKAETLVSFMAFGLLGWLYLTAEPLILFLLGDKWYGAIEIHKLLCLSGFVYPVSTAALSMLKAIGASKEFLKLEIAKKSINILGLIIGFNYGLKGFLISLIFTGVINVLLNMYAVQKKLELDIYIQLRHVLPYLMVAILSVGIITLLPVNFNSHFLSLMIFSTTYASFYILINYALKLKGLDLVLNKARELLSSYRKKKSGKIS